MTEDHATSDSTEETSAPAEEGSALAPARPTPVRQAMGSAPDASITDPSRRFVVGEETWVALVAGRSLTGRQGDRGAPLLHITFHDTAEASPPLRELLVVGTTLDVYADEELPTLLARSRPYREPKPADRPKRRDQRRGGS